MDCETPQTQPLNSPPEQPQQEITIKIRTFEKDLEVQISNTAKISNLKEKIESVSKVPSNRQRLIFRGHLLKDEETISSYKISDKDVVHLIAKLENETNEQNNNNNESQNNAEVQGNLPFFFCPQIL